MIKCSITQTKTKSRFKKQLYEKQKSVRQDGLSNEILTSECIGKLNLLKAQFCAFKTSDSTTIPLTVQNWQNTS